MKREHLFITTRHFDNCHKFQIFGVGKASINQFGLVNIDDIIFFYSKDYNLVIGPYKVISNIFYNEEIIWEEKDGIDAFPYRVRLKSEEVVFAIDGNSFSQMVEENGIRVDSGDLGQKSVFTFFPKDLCIIESNLKIKGQKIKKPSENSNFEETTINIELSIKHGFTESFLEFFLLKKFNEFFNNKDLIPHNQLRINLLGSKIDILALSSKMILVIELKKDVIREKSNRDGKDDIERFQEYIIWVQKNKNLLEKFFKLDLGGVEVQSFMIGSDVQQKLLSKNFGFTFKKYSLDNSQLVLSDVSTKGY